MKDHGLSIAALELLGQSAASRTAREEHHQVTLDTIRLASTMGIDRVVMMSGLPGGPGDANPNWIITDWPPECLEILKISVGRKTHPLLARPCRLCEQSRHPQALSRIAWPSGRLQRPYAFQAARRCGRDCRRQLRSQSSDVDECRSPRGRSGAGRGHLLCPRQGYPGRTRSGRHRRHRSRPAPPDRFAERSWNYITLGYGHGETWWRQFCTALKLAGYDDVLSIEHEDMMMSPMEGMRKSVELLRRAAINVALSK